jgi:hypothetical protein
MGFVYRARDTSTGQAVALKLLHAAPSSSHAGSRLSREARLLAELHHPAIVSYVAQGLTGEGEPFLAMEWLEGEDLAQRLTKRGLRLLETMTLVGRIAAALAVAHEQGIVHRDIKPANLFLREGRVEQVVLLDFGIARSGSVSQALTRTGTIVGTAEYMAPEQASGQHEVSPSADIFSLGCVLYECLTGRSPFLGEHLVATLAKILSAEPPPLHQLRREAPECLQPLLRRMLAKDPAQRFQDGRALSAALLSLDGFSDLAAPTPAEDAPSIGRVEGEQKLMSIILSASDAAPSDSATMDVHDVTLPPAKLEDLRQTLSLYGARVDQLVDGSLLATLVPGLCAATDQAALSVRCALLIKERWPEAIVALATGRGVLHEHLPSGEAIDRAGRLLQTLRTNRAERTVQVVIDEVTAGLLDARFHVSRMSTGVFGLHGEELLVDASRPLLGKPTPCVGRDQELAMLEMIFKACADEGSAQAVLLTGPAGAGKSRLRHELLRRLEARREPPLVLFGRGELMGAGSSYGLLGQAVRRLAGVRELFPSRRWSKIHFGQAVRRLAGVREGKETEVRREKLRQRVARHIPAPDASDVVEFLGELCGVPFPDETSPRLRAARSDPNLMHTQVSHALSAFLKAESLERPILLVLEDLHWGDALTVKLVDEMLRDLAEHRLMVLALARPEVRDLFPGLWVRCLQEIALRGLSKKASAQLARQVLGPQIEDAVVERIVEQAAGNALFLEELIRMVVEGKGDATPETVLAMLQGRILNLPAGARGALLPASVFGQTFWRGGISALIRDEPSPLDLDTWLEHLVTLEIIEPQHQSRFPAEAEYRFRHALVRDAAYSLLPEAHKPVAHKLAGAYLEAIGEQDPLLLAEHYHLGEDLERALYWYVRSAEQLFERHDLTGALRCIEAGFACGPSAAAESRLRALKASVAFWMEDYAQACEVGSATLLDLSVGSYHWCKLVSILIAGSGALGRTDDVAELGRRLFVAQPDADATTAYVEAISFLCNICSWTGRRQEASVFLARMDEIGAGIVEHDPIARGWISFAHSWFGYLLEENPWQTLAWAEQGTMAFDQVGSQRNQVAPESVAGLALAALGDAAGAERTLRRSLGRAQKVGQPYPIGYAMSKLALTLAASPDASCREEARAFALERVAENNNLLQLGLSHTTLSMVAMRKGELTEAEADARKACDLLSIFLPFWLLALALLSKILREQGRAADARETAALGVRQIEQMGGAGAGEIPLRLALAEASYADGRTLDADAELRACLSALEARAATIVDPAARERFLRDVPEHARAFELACLRLSAPG